MPTTETRTVQLTVYAIESKLLDATKYGDARSVFIPGRTYVKAQGSGVDHKWETDPARERCWIGDVVDVEVVTKTYTIEEAASALGVVPPIVERFMDEVR